LTAVSIGVDTHQSLVRQKAENAVKFWEAIAEKTEAYSIKIILEVIYQVNLKI
jgi:hypothetical protein